jgi:hypothetical protein
VPHRNPQRVGIVTTHQVVNTTNVMPVLITLRRCRMVKQPWEIRDSSYLKNIESKLFARLRSAKLPSE